jgi:hypothetical protein
MNSQTPPKGSLEELFRHHLLESEAAAVPPRPLVWEHIDNSLLLAQNEKYRRRLLVHRWGIAASLLLAALAGGGWWHSQQTATTTSLASATGSAAHQALVRARNNQRLVAGGSAQRTAGQLAPAAATGSLQGESTTPTSVAGYGSGHPTATELAQVEATFGRAAGASHQAGALAASAIQPAGRGHSAAVAATRHARAFSARGAAGAGTLASEPSEAFSFTNTQPIGTTATSSLADAPAAGARKSRFGATAALANAAELPTPETTSEEMALLAANPLGEAGLATRPVALALGPDGALPATLALTDITPLPATKLRRWQFGVEYAASTFNPNIDFERSNSAYNTALGFNTVGVTKSAAAEYRANLRAGLGQRLGLRATRWLGGHWSLSTGLEATQQEAHSATSSAFVGDQVATFTNNLTSPTLTLQPSPLEASSFRYRSVGIPVELRYGNPVKTGVSFYGRVGAIVSALLSVRSEVAGNAEATRTYSFFSASTPYRRLTALLRGSAGIHYRPARHSWGLNVGPTAEAGVQSMNAETDKNFLQQNRPYSFGIEAGFEFGGGLVPVQ